VAIGNIHGAITGAAKDQKKVEARLNIQHLQQIARVTGIPWFFMEVRELKENTF